MLLVSNYEFNHRLYTGQWVDNAKPDLNSMLLSVCGFPGEKSYAEMGYPLVEMT